MASIEYRCLHCTAVAFADDAAGGDAARGASFGKGATAGWVTVRELGGPDVVSQPGETIRWAGCPVCAELPLEERDRRNDGLPNA